MIYDTEKDESAFAAELVKTLPKTMRVGGYDFRIQKVSTAEAASSQRYGECSSVQQLIGIQEWFPSRYKCVDTVVHEITHAIFWAYDLKDDDKEERIVCALGSGWMAFYRDNPWFLDWIKSACLA
jgi:hypothetical protein